MPPARKIYAGNPSLCRITAGRHPGRNGQRISLQFRVMAHRASASASRAWLTVPLRPRPRPRLERTSWQPSRRHASTAAVVHRVVALFVVLLVSPHFEAANVVASRSSVSGNVAGGAVLPGFDRCTSSRVTVAGQVRARHATGGTGRNGMRSERNGMGRSGRRRARRGSARRAADRAGRGRTGHGGTRRMGRDAAVHGGAGRRVTSRGAGPEGT